MGWEYPAYLFVLCIAQALLGDGHFALSSSYDISTSANQVPKNAPSR